MPERAAMVTGAAHVAGVVWLPASPDAGYGSGRSVVDDGTWSW